NDDPLSRSAIYAGCPFEWITAQYAKPADAVGGGENLIRILTFEVALHGVGYRRHQLLYGDDIGTLPADRGQQVVDVGVKEQLVEGHHAQRCAPGVGASDARDEAPAKKREKD